MIKYIKEHEQEMYIKHNYSMEIIIYKLYRLDYWHNSDSYNEDGSIKTLYDRFKELGYRWKYENNKGDR